MTSGRRASGNLDVDFGVRMREAVFIQYAIRDGFKREGIATRDFQFFQSVGHALEVFSAFKQFAAIGADDFVDAISEKKTSVVGRYCNF